VVRFASILRALRDSRGTSALSRSRLLGVAPPCERPASLYSRGPRSGPGYVVLDHHHLSGPIRQHIAISPLGSLYAMPSLCGSRLGDPRADPGFHCTFLPDMPSPNLRPQGVRHRSVPGNDVDIGLRQVLNSSALPQSRQSVSRRVSILQASRPCGTNSEFPLFRYATPNSWSAFSQSKLVSTGSIAGFSTPWQSV